MFQQITHDRKQRVQRKVRSRIRKETERLRLSVYRSHKHISGQIIDDVKQQTICAVVDLHIEKAALTKTEKARQTGLLLAEKLNKLGIGQLVFDRGSYKYAGRVKAFCEGVRDGGITI